MSKNKTLLAAAIIGLLASANASAVELGVDPARVYAEELEDGTLLTDTNDVAEFELGYNFSPGEVRYGRYECSDNLSIDNAVVTNNSAGANLVLVGSVNGQGTEALFFSLTADAGVTAGTDDVLFEVDADNTLEAGGAVTCAFSIYDQPSQAQAGGTAGRIYTTGFQPFIARAKSFDFSAIPGEAIADVEAVDGAYTRFLNTGEFGELKFVVSAAAPLKADGTAIALGDIFHTDTTVTVTGDFSAAVDLEWDGDSADDLTSTVATYDYANAANEDGALLFVEDGTTPILAGSYTATLNAEANVGYVVDSVGPIAAGKISRNGTELQAPLVQVPGGWLARIVLTNTGSLDRPYTITALNAANEDTGAAGKKLEIVPAKLEGTIPAGGTQVIRLNDSDLDLVTGGRRGTVVVTVAGPNDQIQGLYQVVNPSNGLVNNHVLVRPGTN